MEKWVTLAEILKIPEEQERIFERKIEYVPQKDKSLIFLPSRTGTTNLQEFSAEIDHTYYPICQEGWIWLVACEASKKKLTLAFDAGYINGIRIMTDIAQLYSQPSIHAKGMAWTKETIGILDKLPVSVRKIKEEYWTAIVDTSTEKYNKALKSVSPQGLKTNILYYKFYGTTAGNRFEKALRPLIRLPANILIDIEGDEKSPLKIKQPDGSKKTQYKDIIFARLRTKLRNHAPTAEIEELIDEIERSTLWKNG